MIRSVEDTGSRAALRGRPAPCRPRKWVRWAPLGGIVVAVGCLVGTAGPVVGEEEKPDPPSAAETPARHPREKTLLKRRWGVEVIGVRRASAGYMLEFRYKVVDPEKAAPLFVRQTKPVLVDEATGAEFVVPTPGKVGPLRNSEPPRDRRVYWMFFANPGRFVKPGSRVSVVIGDFRADGLIVQ